jgi:hypothetical protein
MCVIEKNRKDLVSSDFLSQSEHFSSEVNPSNNMRKVLNELLGILEFSKETHSSHLLMALH